MAYPQIPYPPTQTNIKQFLLNIGQRKEFQIDPDVETYDSTLKGLCPHGAQEFIKRFFSPNTPYPRILLNWQTGTGKTLGMLGIAAEFIQNAIKLKKKII